MPGTLAHSSLWCCLGLHGRDGVVGAGEGVQYCGKLEWFVNPLDAERR